MRNLNANQVNGDYLPISNEKSPKLEHLSMILRLKHKLNFCSTVKTFYSVYLRTTFNEQKFQTNL